MQCQGIRIDEGLKNNVRAVLLSKIGGVLMTDFLRDYAELVQKPLKFQELGFKSLETFFRAIPDTARLEYSPNDKTMRIFGIPKPNTYVSKMAKKAQGLNQSSHVKGKENSGGSEVDGPTPNQLKSLKKELNTSVKQEPKSRVLDLQSLKPDDRGWYSLCFPIENEPHGEPLEEMFQRPGPLMDFHRTATYIFVRYSTVEAVQTAYEMFRYLDIRVASNKKDNIKGNKRQFVPHSDVPSNTGVGDRSHKYLANGETRVPVAFQESERTVQEEVGTQSEDSFVEDIVEFPNGSSGTEADEFCTELFIGNIPKEKECTKEKVRALLSPHRIAHLYWKRSKKKTFAFALLYSRREAEEAVEKLNGLEFMGRTLKVRMSDIRVAGRVGEAKSPKTAPQHRVLKESLFDHITEHGIMPDLEDSIPDLEDDMSDDESDAPAVLHRVNVNVVPSPVITRQVIASGLTGDSLQITRQVDPGVAEYGDFGSEVVRRMGGKVNEHRDSGPGAAQLVSSPGRGRGISAAAPVVHHDNPLASEPESAETEDPAILVANFRKGTTKEELRALFFRYHPLKVDITSSPKCTKAVIRLSTVADVKAAIAEMNQEMYMGLRLLVDVPYHCPNLRSAIFGPETVNKEKKTTSELVKEHHKIMTALQAKAPKLHLGQRVEVLITSAITDNFFWGQIVNEEDLEQLRLISSEINNGESHFPRATGLGPCKAIFGGDGLWYRAWVISTGGSSAEVFYVDYGNSGVVAWSETAKLSDQRMWDLRPLAVPVILTDKILSLKERELTSVTVEVAALRNPEEGQGLIAKPISLLGNLQAFSIP